MKPLPPEVRRAQLVFRVYWGVFWTLTMATAALYLWALAAMWPR